MTTKRSRTELADMLWARQCRFGAEVGVWKGGFSEVLLQRTCVEMLYCVDAWDGTGMSKEFVGHKVFMEAQARLRPYGKRAQLMQGKSVDVAKQIQDGRLDFVYIDADHTYAGISADLDAWLPKLRSGGVLLGHDYSNRRGKGVKRAVDERFGMRVRCTEERCKNWWVVVS